MPITQNATILLTDLVGSTELAYSLTPIEADELRRSHFSTLRQAIDDAGGTEVKNLGDGIMAAFRSSSAALACAVSMQQATELQNRKGNRHLGLRVGISAGEVGIQEGDYFGDAVSEVVALCGRAAGGQILAAELVRALASRRNALVFQPLGEVELERLAEPIEVVEVGWEPLPELAKASELQGDIPLPASLASMPNVGGVIGRDEQDEILTHAYKQVESGNGREVVLVGGEPGVGKSTLVAAFTRRAKELGACVLLGHYDEYLTVSYQGFSEAMSHYVRHAPEARLREHIEADGSDLAIIVPALRPFLEGGDLARLATETGESGIERASDPGAQRHMLFSAVVDWLARVSLGAPVVLVLEDLHWADTQSLQLFQHLVTATTALRLLVVGTYREEFRTSHPFHQTLAALRREPRVTQVSLSGLDEGAVLSLIEGHLAHNVGERGTALARALREETDGNPFFVSEVLQHLLETGVLGPDTDGPMASGIPLDQGSLPESLRQVIGTRVFRLGEQATRVLSLAAVIGRDFDLDVVAAASGLDESPLLDLLDEAQGASLVAEIPDEPGRYRFAHALIAHTLREDLGPTKRARAHQRIAVAFEALMAEELGLDHIEEEQIEKLPVPTSRKARRGGGRIRQIAHHYARTVHTSDRARALEYCHKAGDAALTTLAPHEARDWFEQAVQLDDEMGQLLPGRSIDILIGLGTAQRHAGDSENRETLLGAAGRARALGDHRRLAKAILIACDGGLSAVFGNVDAEKLSCLEGALATAGEEDSPTKAVLLATLCSELTFQAPLGRRLALADAALAIAQRLEDPCVLGSVLNTIQYALDVPETLESRLEQTAQALSLGERHGDPGLSFWTVWLRSIAAMQAAVPDEIDRCMAAMARLRDLRGYPVDREMTLIRQCALSMLHGDPDQAERFAEAALKIGLERGLLDAWSTFGAQLIVIRWEQGRLAELVDMIAGQAEANPGVPAFRAALALAHSDAGNATAAQELLDTAAHGEFSEVTRDTGWLVALHAYAEVAIQLSHRAAATSLFELIEPSRAQMGANALVVSGPSAHYLGGLARVLGRFDEAERFLAEAADISHRLGARFFGARTALEWGRLLLSQSCTGNLTGSANRSSGLGHDLVREALSSAHRYGYTTVAKRAAAALAEQDRLDVQQA